MSDQRVIKRYANRKLYDTQHSRYVTLDQIAEMIRNGDDVQIIDNKTKEDLTSVTLAQIIFEEEKKQRSFLPLQAMRNIIQSGGESISNLVSTAQKRVTDILPQKDKDEEDAALADGTSDGDSAKPGTMGEFRDWLQLQQRTLDDWQKRIDERVRSMALGITSPIGSIQGEVQALRARIAELEGKLRGMIKKPGEGDGGESGGDEDRPA